MLCGERLGDRATQRCHDSQNALRWSETLSQDQVLLLQPTITDVQLFLDSYMYQHDQLSQSQFLEKCFDNTEAKALGSTSEINFFL